MLAYLILFFLLTLALAWYARRWWKHTAWVRYRDSQTPEHVPMTHVQGNVFRRDDGELVIVTGSDVDSTEDDE